MGSQGVRHDWETELNWTDDHVAIYFFVLGSSLYTLSVFPGYRRSFSICWGADLMVLNSLSFYLSVKLLISPSYLNEILSVYSNMGCRFFSFITLSMSCHSLLVWGVSIERSVVILMGIPLYVICCFSLAAFNICSLCLIFVNLINMCLEVFCFGFILFGTMGFLDLGDYFLPYFGEVSNYYLLKYFLMVFLFVFFFWDSYDLNVEAFNIVPDVSEVVLISFNSFFFFPVCFIYFYLLPHLSYLLPPLFYCWFPPECFWSKLLHYSLYIDSFLFLLGPC